MLWQKSVLWRSDWQVCNKIYGVNEFFLQKITVNIFKKSVNNEHEMLYLQRNEKHVITIFSDH